MIETSKTMETIPTKKTLRKMICPKDFHWPYWTASRVTKRYHLNRPPYHPRPSKKNLRKLKVSSKKRKVAGRRMAKVVRILTRMAAVILRRVHNKEILRR